MADSEELSDSDIDEILGKYEELLDRQDVRPNAFLESLGLLSDIQEKLSEFLGDAYREAFRRHGPLRRGQSFGVGEKYLIVESIGRGGHGHVYLAEAKLSDARSMTRQVALKILTATGRDKVASARFRREQQHASQIDHPNLIVVYEADDYNGYQYIAMLYVPADENGDRTLNDWLKRREPVGAASESFATQWLLEIAEGIQALHATHVIHRDIKPHNILLWRTATSVQVIVADLGLARSSEDTLITEPFMAVGTWDYISPEQLTGSSCDQRSDLYSFGVTAYQFLTGRLPFASQLLPGDLVKPQIPDGEATPLSTLCPGLDSRLEDIVMRCLARNPEQRTRDIGLVVKTFREIIQNPGLRRDSWLRRVFRWMRRPDSRFPLLWKGTLGVLALFIVMLLLVSSNRISNRTSGTPFSGSPLLSNAIDELPAAPAVTQKTGAQLAVGNQVQPGPLPVPPRNALSGPLHQRLLAEVQTAINQGDHVEALRKIRSVEPGDITWADEYLKQRLISLPNCRELATVHDWGVSAALLNSDGQSLLTFGNEGRAVATSLIAIGTQELRPGAWDTAKRRGSPVVETISSGIDSPQQKPELVTQIAPLGPQIGTDSQRLVTVSQQGRAAVWNWTKNGLELQKVLLAQHSCPLTAVCSSRDDQELLLGDAEGRLFRSNGQDPVQLLKVHLDPSPILDLVRLSAKTVAVAQANGTLSCISTDGNKLLFRQKYAQCIWDMDVSTTASLLAIATEDSEVLTLRWNEEQTVLSQESRYQLPIEVDGEFTGVHAVRFSPSGQTLVAGDNLGRFALWDVAQSRPVFIEYQEKRDAYLTVRNTWPSWLQKTYRGFEFYDEERRVASYGCDGVLKLWDVSRDAHRTIIAGPRNPLLRAVPGHPDWIWIAGEQSLSVRNVVTQECVTLDPAHLNCAVSALAIPAEGTIAITGDVEGHVRFWQWRDGKIVKMQRDELQIEGPVKALAVDPLVKNLAAFDSAGVLHQWTFLKSGPPTTQSCRVDLPLRPLLAYGDSGKRLACTGPDQEVRVFDPRDLTKWQRPQLAAGRGATCFFWPENPLSTLIAGDSDGALRIHSFERERHLTFTPRPLLSSVAGIATCQPGNLLAAISEKGFVRLTPLAGGEPLFSFSIRNVAQPDNPVVAVESDASGKHLIAGFQDGTLEVLSTSTALKRPPTVKSATWTQHEIVNEAGLQLLMIRPSSVQCLPQGGLAILHASTRKSPPHNLPAESIGLSVWKDGTCTHYPVSQVDASKQPSVDGEVRSLNVYAASNTLWTAYRHPMPEEGPFVGIIRLQQWSIEPNGELHLIPSTSIDRDLIGNHGFDLHSAAGASDKPIFWHFSHSGHYLLCTNWDGTRWSTSFIGRQGDGFAQSGNSDLNGRFHSLFRTNRFNAEPAVPVYLSVEQDTTREIREVFDRFPLHQIYAVTILENVPVVMYSRRRGRDRFELVLAERCESQWRLEVL
ncbi:MAG: hypothetical protein JWM11_3835, partial [Planctomycetaceae bacterium]|nr:hypothetical protein [Planctomycetaceae bacterium]